MTEPRAASVLTQYRAHALVDHHVPSSPKEFFGSATFSVERSHRYLLTRDLRTDPRFATGRTLFSVGLNPSTADAAKPDPTITRDIGFARRWGCDELVKLNAYAFRTKSPAVLKRAARDGVDVVGELNDVYIALAASIVKPDDVFLVSWGRHVDWERQQQLARIVGGRAVCLGTNSNGTPRHELYLSYEEQLSPWSCPS